MCHLHLAPPQGVIAVEFRGDLWHQKTRSLRYRVILRLAVLVEHRLVTDRRTDTGVWLVRRMHSIARRAVKIVTAFMRNACSAFSPSPDTYPPNITIADICPKCCKFGWAPNHVQIPHRKRAFGVCGRLINIVGHNSERSKG